MPLTLRKWNLSIGGGQPLFCILGLNVLEDTGLALETARHLKQVTAELDLPFVFKASFDKANRSSFKSYRGPGLEQRSEERRVGKECAVRVDLGGRRIINKKTRRIHRHLQVYITYIYKTIKRMI